MSSGHQLAMPERTPHIPPSLDWRFLLPTPRLTGRAVVVGTPPSRRRTMVAALGDVVRVTPLGDVRADADGAVVFGVHPGLLATAAAAVRPGGWVYVELGRLRLPRRPATAAGSLRRAGFGAVHVYWHWPTFDSCREMVPLGDRVAMRASIARRSSAGVSGLLYRTAGLAHRAGVLDAIVPDISIVGTRVGDS
jgi:hypothetical protein